MNGAVLMFDARNVPLVPRDDGRDHGRGDGRDDGRGDPYGAAPGADEAARRGLRG